jgi:hypothetical protein
LLFHGNWISSGRPADASNCVAQAAANGVQVVAILVIMADSFA